MIHFLIITFFACLLIWWRGIVKFQLDTFLIGFVGMLITSAMVLALVVSRR